MINYEEFLELYKPFSKSITEKEFSKIIRMSYSTYRNIKNLVKIIAIFLPLLLFLFYLM